MGIRYFMFGDLLTILSAGQWTLLLTVIAFAGGIVVSAVITLARISPSRFFRSLAWVYVELIQGTPLILQIFLWYFLLSLLVPVQLPALFVAALSLTLNASAFISEIWRGSIEAIPKNQWDSAASIGMSRMQQVRHIIAPQAMRIALGPTVGLLVIVLKGTSLTSLIGFVEVTRASQLISGVTFEPLKTYAVASLVYFVLCTPLSMLSRAIEKRFNVYH